MKTPAAILAAAGLAFGLTAGSIASPAGASDMNIVETAIAVSGPDAGVTDTNPGDFDILINGVVAAGLVDALSAKGQRTVFAPSDAAFMAFTGTDNEDDALAAVGSLDAETLAAVISYHVAPGARTADEVVPAERIRTITKQFITKAADSGTLVDGQGRSVNIVATDVMASNGVIHVIDNVLLPPS